eukprot:TRINITY_DN8115_c0_g1_i1.p1 TRINITY_DN8115_c0_g1~~TRINITY_DN8115_c0_g1_i1.p1  ORF type:complete len:102 (-),score=14.81 TRINITY_DN8115_c0_g1_i1:105-410(-)
MSTDDDRFFPAWDESGYIVNDDGLSEDGSIEDVSDGSIGRFPHGFQVELFDSCLIGSDGGTFDANFTLFDGFGSFDGDFVIGFISVLHAKIEILDLEIEER